MTAFTSQGSISKGSRADDAKLKLQKIRDRAAKEQKEQEMQLLHQFLVETMQGSGTPHHLEGSSDLGIPSAIHGGSFMGAGLTDNQFTFTSSQMTPQQPREEVELNEEAPLNQRREDDSKIRTNPITGMQTRPRDSVHNKEQGRNQKLSKTTRQND